VLVAVFAILAAVAVNEVNLWSLRTSALPEARQSVYGDELVFSPDQHDYLSPAISYARGQGWRFEGHTSIGSHFARTPGYSLIYYALYRVFGEDESLRALKWLQLLLLGVSVACLHTLLRHLTGRPRFALVATLLYALLPIGMNFVYYAMTEAVTPAYMVFYVSALFASLREERDDRARMFLIVSGVLWAVLALTRPVTALVGLLLPVFGLVRFGWVKGARSLCLAICPFLLAAGAWSLRNYIICSCFVPLEARHPSLFALWYGPSYGAFQSFTACWATNTEINDYLKPLWDPAMAGRSTPADIDKVVALIPRRVVTEFGETRLAGALRELQKSMVAKAPYRVRGGLPNEYLPEELQARDAFTALADECKRRDPVRYWLTNTGRYLGYLVLHSNTTSLYFFQAEYRHHRWLNLLRQGLGAGHVFLYLSLLLLPLVFLRQTPSAFLVQTMTFVVVPAVFIAFFTIGYRSIEQRYMLPYLPILYAGVVTGIAALGGRERSATVLRPDPKGTSTLIKSTELKDVPRAELLGESSVVESSRNPGEDLSQS
jgi:hypothetical protein